MMTYPYDIDQNPSAASHNKYPSLPIQIFLLLQSVSDDFAN